MPKMKNQNHKILNLEGIYRSFKQSLHFIGEKMEAVTHLEVELPLPPTWPKVLQPQENQLDYGQVGDAGEYEHGWHVASSVVQISLVQVLSCVRLFMTQWIAEHQLPRVLHHFLEFAQTPSSRWCQPTISSSVIPFSSCLQSFTASGSFQWVSSLHQVAKVLELQLQHHSFQ